MFSKDLHNHNFDTANLRPFAIALEKLLNGEDHHTAIHWRGISIVKIEDEVGFASYEEHDGSYKIIIDVDVFRGKPESEDN